MFVYLQTQRYTIVLEGKVGIIFNRYRLPNSISHEEYYSSRSFKWKRLKNQMQIKILDSQFIE